MYFLVLTTYANAARGSKNDLSRLEYNLNCSWGIFKQYNALSIGLRAKLPTQDFWRPPEMFVTREPKASYHKPLESK